MPGGFVAITTNVGSIFEQSRLQVAWLKTFNQFLEKGHELVAVHCQEVGGKGGYQPQLLQAFLSELKNLPAVKTQYRSLLAFMDEGTTDDVYTALGNLYFIHKDMSDVQIFSFRDQSFHSVDGPFHFYGGDLLSTPDCVKFKFPLDHFPGSKYSRKGCIITRWQVGNRVLDLANVHLIHDSCNMESFETTPSIFCEYRRKMLRYVLHKLESIQSRHFIIFGDMNFRTDLCSMLKALGDHRLEVVMKPCSNSVEALVGFSADNQMLFKLERRTFFMANENRKDLESHQHLKKFDIELDSFKTQLFELDLNFPPSYPIDEDSESIQYGDSRCPSWCDRIVFSKDLFDTITKNQNEATYDLMLGDHCIGDHIPVYFHAPWSALAED